MTPAQVPQAPVSEDTAPSAPGPSPQDLLQAMQAAGALVIILIPSAPKRRSIKY